MPHSGRKRALDESPEGGKGWFWYPPDARVFRDSRYLLSVVPGSRRQCEVHWSRCAPEEVEELIGKVMRQVRGAGGKGLHWCVRTDTQPKDMETRLKDHGYRLDEDVDVLTWDLGTDPAPRLPPFPEQPGVTTAQVLDEASLRTSHRIASEAFGEGSPPEEAMVTCVGELRQSVKTGVWNGTEFIAHVDGRPVASAGVALAGKVARFWGAGALPAFRGRGAYGALVLARCRWAHAHGAELALVKARKGTSRPILLRHGFSGQGSERCHVAPNLDR